MPAQRLVRWLIKFGRVPPKTADTDPSPRVRTGAQLINVFVKRGFRHVWDAYLYEWGGAGAHDFEIRTYEDLPSLDDLPAGPVIFADIERLNDADRTIAAEIERVISAERPDIPILNSPVNTKRRYDLLSGLYERKLNSFRAYRLTDTTTPDQFPVFLRYENDHTGSISKLLRNQHELDRAIVRAQIRLHNLRDLIIVEFVDTSDATGLFKKYSAFKIGDTIIPRGINESTSWVVKFRGSIVNANTAATSLDFVRHNPHELLLRESFDVGNIGYGRIDYSMSGDSVVTWEINTNPVAMSARSDTEPVSLPRQELFLSMFNSAFEAILPSDLDSAPISLASLSPDLRETSTTSGLAMRSSLQHFGRRYKRQLEPGIRLVEMASIPFEQQILNLWKHRSSG